MRDLFTNLKVSTKLLLSFGLVAVVSLLVGIVGIFNINRLQDMDNELYRYQTLPLLELRVINGAFEQNRAYMRDIILENDPKKVETAIWAMEENSKKIDSSLQVFSQSLLTQAEKKEFEYFSNVLENFGYHREQIVELCKTGNKEFARTVLMNDGPKLSANFSRAIDKLSQMKADSGRQTAELNASRSQAAIGVTGFLIVLAGVLAIGLGIGISRIISVPLVAVAAAANKISQGDLTGNIPARYTVAKDEIGQLGMSFSVMAANLKSLVTQVGQSSGQVAASSEELTASIDRSAQASEQIAGTVAGIAQGAEQQMQALMDTVAVVEQMSAGVDKIAVNTATATATADRASSSAEDGSQAISLVISKMNDIKQSVDNSAAVVAELGARSKEIGQIVSTIDGIAAQTNLLALNAAIEAARAGEQGRGFAVVAEEVRKLAEQSQAATKQIENLISSIQQDTGHAVIAMSQGTQEVNAGAEVVGAAGDHFREIAAFVVELSGQIKEIAAAVGQIAASSRQIAGSVSATEAISRDTSAVTQTVSAATEEQSATMTEMAVSSEKLAKLAEQLQQVLQQLRP